MSTKYKRQRRPKPEWNAESVKALREFLNLTQQELSEQLGVRQQTVSEWEVGLHYPRGASVTVLNLVAERAQFKYGEKRALAAAPADSGQSTGTTTYPRLRKSRKRRTTEKSAS